MNFIRLVLIFCLLCSCFASESFAFQNPAESIRWGQSIQELRHSGQFSSYIEGDSKSLFTNRDTHSLLADTSILNTKANILYTFDDGKLRDFVVHINDVHNKDTLYKEMLNHIANRYEPYQGEMFSCFDERFTDKDKTTLIVMTKGNGIFIYCLDYRYHEQYSESQKRQLMTTR